MAEKKADKKAKEGAAEGDKPKSNKMMIIIVAAVALIVGGAGSGVAVFMMSKGSGGESADAAKAEAPVEQKPREASYFDFTTPFLVNYQWRGREHYMQVSLSFLFRDPAVQALIKEHEPLLRNNIMLLLQAQDFDGLRTLEGKESIRQLIFDEVQNVLKAQDSSTEGIEQVYFTNFVLQ
ncbi:Flagellar basal body-associated protein [gamma proteobacterium HdN1]|nr:Flagellar basal body-associated protein [gamma proteobacterium HdN1]